MIKAPFSRILHVDDHKDIRGIVQLALGKIGGFTVRSCTSGEEALAAGGRLRRRSCSCST